MISEHIDPVVSIDQEERKWCLEEKINNCLDLIYDTGEGNGTPTPVLLPGKSHGGGAW